MKLARQPIILYIVDFAAISIMLSVFVCVFEINFWWLAIAIPICIYKYKVTELRYAKTT